MRDGVLGWPTPTINAAQSAINRLSNDRQKNTASGCDHYRPGS